MQKKSAEQLAEQRKELEAQIAKVRNDANTSLAEKDRKIAELQKEIEGAYGKGLTYTEAKSYCESGSWRADLFVTNYGFYDDNYGRFYDFLNGSSMQTHNVNRMLSGYKTIGVAETKNISHLGNGDIGYDNFNVLTIHLFPPADKSFHEIETGYGKTSYVAFDVNKAIAAMIIHDYTSSHRTNEGSVDGYVVVPYFNPDGHDTAKYGEFWACISGKWITKDTTDRRLHNGFWGTLSSVSLQGSYNNGLNPEYYTYSFTIRSGGGSPYSGVDPYTADDFTYNNFTGFHW